MNDPPGAVGRTPQVRLDRKPEESPTDAVLRAAQCAGVDPLSVTPMERVVDTEALDSLLSERHDPDPQTTLVIELWDHRFAVTPSTVAVYETGDDTAGA
jgi:hypothetical protein